MTTTEPLAAPAPSPAALPTVQDAFCPSRGGMASVGFLAGWIPVSCCSAGLVPAILTGFGVGSTYFSLNKTVFWGLGWTPILTLFSLVVVAAASYLMVRPAFARQPREVAWRTYRRTAGMTALAGGISFVFWMELVMPLLYIFGVPMGSLMQMR